MKIIEHIKNNHFVYRESFHYFCLKNCVFQLLSMKSPNAFAYINCAPCIYVYFSPHLEDGYTIRYEKNPLQKEQTSSFDIVEPKYKCAEINFSSITKNIDKNCAVIAAADVYFLPYKHHYFNKFHASHAIIIYGYDSRNKEIHIVDCYNKDSYIGTISYDDFFNAWSSLNPSEANPFSGSPINNVWGVLKLEEYEHQYSNPIVNNIVNVSNCFYGRNGKRCFVGIDGLNRLKSLFQKHIVLENRVNLERLHKNLYMYYREKILLKDYIVFYSESIKLPDLLLSSLEKNIVSWSVFLTHILKVNITKKELSLEKINNFFDDILCSEKELHNYILQTLK